MTVITSKPNFENINYNLRAAKNVERKMLCEAFSRLSMLDSLKNYRYVGFGSTYFTDFNLFHKSLGLTKMVSIEKEKKLADKKRVDFNKPFSCIEVFFGESSEILPRLNWNEWKKTLVWLDYTGKLDGSMLGDIHTVLNNIRAGSVFLMSVNIEQDKKFEAANNTDMQTWRLNQLEKRIDKTNVPLRAYDLMLNVDNNKSVIREVIDNTINRALLVRNGGVRQNLKLYYRQLFNFFYKDGAPMLTIGGVIFNDAQISQIEKMFGNIDFVRDGEKSFDIIIPNLTYREIHALDKLLPTSSTSKIKKSIPLKPTDIDNYKNIYRYFPNFTEVNL